jgi:alkylation response protein AidB-like acyl-CoA dehydrogenase
MHLGRAEGELGAARAYFYGALDEAWQAALAGRRPDARQRLQAQLAASQAVEGAARAVDHIHAAVGATGVRENEQHRFARHFRDVHTITQHALCSPTRFENVGQAMLGLPSGWFVLEL